MRRVVTSLVFGLLLALGLAGAVQAAVTPVSAGGMCRPTGAANEPKLPAWLAESPQDTAVAIIAPTACGDCPDCGSSYVRRSRGGRRLLHGRSQL